MFTSCSRLATLVLVLSSVTSIAPAFAQVRAITQEPAPIYLKPDDRLEPLRTAAPGTVLLVRQQTDDWLQVEFQDPQFGRRIGWVRRARVQVDAGNTRAMDLSIASDEAAPRESADVVRADEVRERGWLDVNLGVAASGAGAEAFVFNGTVFREAFSLTASYPAPSLGASFDIGGGVMITPTVGVGVMLAGTAHADTVGLGARLPHPYFFNAAVSASGATEDEVMRTEGSVHPQVMLVAHQSRRLRARVYGGPSYFRYEADMVQDLDIDQRAALFSPTQTVTITGYDAVTSEGTGWGWHVGGDVSVFFTRVFGLGGFVRYTRGMVEIDEPLSELRQDVRVGGLQAGGGIRLRF